MCQFEVSNELMIVSVELIPDNWTKVRKKIWRVGTPGTWWHKAKCCLNFCPILKLICTNIHEVYNILQIIVVCKFVVFSATETIVKYSCKQL